MVKYFLSFLFTILLCAKSIAQHCPYDYSAIIIVRATFDTSNMLIKDLKMTLLDSTGKIYKNWNQDTLFFWQNPDHTTQRGYIDNNHPMEREKIRFWFAENNYVLVCNREVVDEKIKIEDADGPQNSGEFLTQVVAIKPEEVFPLCTGLSHWNWGREGDFKYEHTISVQLKKK